MTPARRNPILPRSIHVFFICGAGGRVGREARRASVPQILAAFLDADPHRLDFVRSPRGKPVLSGSIARDVSFNVAHAGSATIVAVTGGDEVGVDLEHVRPIRHHEALAARWLEPSIAASIRLLPTGERHVAFLRQWTRREALLKASGSGFPGSAFCDVGDSAVEDGGPAARIANVTVQDLDLPSGWVGALAVEGGPAPIVLHDASDSAAIARIGGKR